MEKITFAHGIIITAIEGGVNYWAKTLEYDYTKSHALIAEYGDEDQCQAVHKISPRVVTGGIRAIKEGTVRMLGNQKRAYIIGQSYLGEDADLDAQDADIIIQAGLFGEVRYG